MLTHAFRQTARHKKNFFFFLSKYGITHDIISGWPHIVIQRTSKRLTPHTKFDQSHHYPMRSPTRFFKSERNAQKKFFFPFQIWYHPWHHLRLTGSVFPHSTTWSHTVNIYVIFAEGKKNFFYKSSFQPKHFSFSPNYAWYVTHIHYPKQIEGEKIIIYSILIDQSLVPSLQQIWKFCLLSMTTWLKGFYLPSSVSCCVLPI